VHRRRRDAAHACRSRAPGSVGRSSSETEVMPPMTQHDFEHWAEATTIGRRVFNYRFRLFGHELKGWERLKAVALQESEDATEIHYVWQHQHDGGRSLVRVAV